MSKKLNLPPINRGDTWSPFTNMVINSSTTLLDGLSVYLNFYDKGGTEIYNDFLSITSVSETQKIANYLLDDSQTLTFQPGVYSYALVFNFSDGSVKTCLHGTVRIKDRFDD